MPVLSEFSHEPLLHCAYDVTKQNKEIRLCIGLRIFYRDILDNKCCGFVYLLDTNHSQCTASLASSSESEDGGVSSPPRKKQRLSASNMQTNGCPQHNGETDDPEPSTSQKNGACSFTPSDYTNGTVSGEKIE